MTTLPEFEIDVEARGNQRSVRVEGELDSATCEKLAETVERVLADPQTDEVVLDLENVSFIDSAGLRTMLVIEQSAERRGVPLEVRPPPEHMMELLCLTGIAERLRFSRTEAEMPTVGDFVERVELELPPDPRAPGRARAELRESIAAHLDRSALDSAMLATSELVTNAVIHPERHGDEPILLGITVHEDRLRVEVTDPGQGFDPAAPIRATSTGGRGLLVVDRCASRWGAVRPDGEPGGRFCVWFEIDTPKPRAGTAVAG